MVAEIACGFYNFLDWVDRGISRSNLSTTPYAPIEYEIINL